MTFELGLSQLSQCNMVLMVSFISDIMFLTVQIEIFVVVILPQSSLYSAFFKDSAIFCTMQE